ncbi:MAG: hypothetical protein A3F42_08060 [Gammaproteobacteria bacterium RIFCSPHIGHO2_12_FULL_37_34]|nr:MAG: hypothetical protein A3F42_08060 [Gammaproteobacteria bacterium RIFCSPHIGHO2_12_FULL_37_34]
MNENNPINPLVRMMDREDIVAVSDVHCECFQRQMFSKEWAECNFKASPRIMMYVAVYDGQIAGYIQWLQKSGFRKKSVMELEQIAIKPPFQRQGIGAQLITESLHLLKQNLLTRNMELSNVLLRD